jgi:hypothetical protein
MAQESRNVKTHLKPVRRGLAIYRTGSSPYWYARIWLPGHRRYLVRSTKERSRVKAHEAAEEIINDLRAGKQLDRVARDRTFEFFAEMLLSNDEAEQDLHPLTAANERYILYRETDGVLVYMGRSDVASVDTQKIRDYLKWLDAHRDKPISASTKSKHVNVIRKVLATAFDSKAISSLPRMPKVPRRDNPRSWFTGEELEVIEDAAIEAAEEGVSIRGVRITRELYLFMDFLVHTFVRPTESEVFALRHRDLRLRDRPRSLQVFIEKPKTKNASNWSDSTEWGPVVYHRLKDLYPDYKPSDYVFLPAYENRTTAKRIFERQFNYVLERAGLKSINDKRKHTVYSLRHTAITMRLIESRGKVNLLNLARNARTSVAQIERFYTAKMPMTGGMVENLQTYDDD